MRAFELLEEVINLLSRGLYAEEEDGQWLSDRRNNVQETMYNARCWLAEAYAQQGLMGRAEIQWRIMLTDDPTDEDVLGIALVCLHQHGMTSKALRLFKRAEQRSQRAYTHW